MPTSRPCPAGALLPLTGTSILCSHVTPWLAALLEVIAE
jgi:hypothetical protein